MPVFFNELRRSRLSLLIWTGVLSFMLSISVLVYPEMAHQMTDINDMFSDMGSFSAAFGMDQLNFGEFLGYFGIECGNTLGLGGALFAAITGISALAKEEKDRTAEFLFTHPRSRNRILGEKLLSVGAQILFLNVIVAGTAVATTLLIGETGDAKTMFLLFFSYFLLQLEIASITFGISAFLRNGGLGIGMGIALILYFLNLLSNLIPKVEFIKYITPFSYTDASKIITDLSIEPKYLFAGCLLAAAGIAAGFFQYNRKDIF